MKTYYPPNYDRHTSTDKFPKIQRFNEDLSETASRKQGEAFLKSKPLGYSNILSKVRS